jgi:hypothetical protein
VVLLTPVEAAIPDALLELTFTPEACDTDPEELTAPEVEAILLDDAIVARELAAVPAVDATFPEDAGVTEDGPVLALVGVTFAETGHTVCKC